MSNRATTPSINRPQSRADAMRRRKTDWVGIITLAFGLFLVAVCLYSALTDRQNTSDAGAPSLPIASRSQNANR